VLGKLWKDGSMSIKSERFSGEEYKELLRGMVETEKNMFEQMSNQQIQLYNDVDELRSEICAIENEEAFVSGFRLGARVMLEVMGDV